MFVGIRKREGATEDNRLFFARYRICLKVFEVFKHILNTVEYRSEEVGAVLHDVEQVFRIVKHYSALSNEQVFSLLHTIALKGTISPTRALYRGKNSSRPFRALYYLFSLSVELMVHYFLKMENHLTVHSHFINSAFAIYAVDGTVAHYFVAP